MKLPKKSKKVFSGVMFDVYQWNQKMFNGSHETFEMLKRPNTIEIIVEKDGKILIADEEQPVKGRFYSLFGGRQEKDETPLKAAKRELLEETGMISDDWELIKTYDPVGKIDWTIYLYVARGCKKVKKQNLDAGEKINIVEMSFDKFITFASSEKFGEKHFSNDLFRIMHDKKKFDEFRKKILR